MDLTIVYLAAQYNKISIATFGLYGYISFKSCLPPTRAILRQPADLSIQQKQLQYARAILLNTTKMRLRREQVQLATGPPLINMRALPPEYDPYDESLSQRIAIDNAETRVIWSPADDEGGSTSWASNVAVTFGDNQSPEGRPLTTPTTLRINETTTENSPERRIEGQSEIQGHV